MLVDKSVEKIRLERDIRRIGTNLKQSAATFSNWDRVEISVILSKQIRFRYINFFVYTHTFCRGIPLRHSSQEAASAS